MIAPRTLEQLRNRPTSYEVVAVHSDGRDPVRLAFTARRTKGRLLLIAQENRELLLEWLGDSPDMAVMYSRERGWNFGPFRVCFSGRTERDCASG